MKTMRLFLAAVAAVGAVFADASYDEGMSTLTLDGVTTNVTAEADLGAATNVVFANGGGVAFDMSGTLAKKYSISGDGLAATGVVSVASGQSVIAGKANLADGTLGHVFVKSGAGTLHFSAGPGAVSTPTRWLVEEGSLTQAGGDIFGNHRSTTVNLTVDVREGAEYVYASGVGHCPMGPLELTGGKFRALSSVSDTAFWANTAFKGGITAHASETPSVVYLNGRAHLGHCEYSNIVFNVETGAKLIIDGILTNGYDTAEQPSGLVKRGGGELVLLRHGGWTGGTTIEEGTITVACPTALGVGGVKLAGDATLNVVPGITLACGALTGTGTLTKTGDGGVSFASVADGVTVARAAGEGTLPTAFIDGTVHLCGGVATIDVPAGETWTVTGFDVTTLADYPSLSRDIVKTGAGKLVLPSGDNASSFRNLTVQDGVVQVAAENNLGAGTTTLTGGGTLTISGNVTFTWRKIKCVGTGVLDVPEGMTMTVGTNSIWTADATLLKRGAGKLVFSPTYYNLNGNVTASTRWVCDEGAMQFPQDPFGGHTTAAATTIECHEGAVLCTAGHTPLGRIVLRGGTMKFIAGNNNALAPGSGQVKLESEVLTRWCGFSLNGTIGVLPAAGGAESTIDAARSYLAHASHETVFDVKDGATLRVKGRLRDGYNSDGTTERASGFTKTGGGEMILEGAADTAGTIKLQAGTLTVEEGSAVPDAARLDVSPGATLRLADGAATGVGVSAEDPFLRTADVWFDATRLAVANNADVASALNFGTAGGTFKKANAPAPKYKTDAINGLSAIHCDGGMALVLDSYTNYNDNLTVFMVAQWTSWENTGGKGHWGGGLSMSYYAATGTDNATPYSYHTETATTVSNTASYSTLANITITNPNRGINTPYLDMIAYVTNRATFVQYLADDIVDVSGGAAKIAGNFKIDRMAIGGRLKGAGQVQYSNSATDPNNRMYIGDIGEVVVFSRVLTPAEHALVAAYLKRKWFNSTATATDPVPSSGTGLAIDVPEGTGGFAGAVASGSLNSGATLLRKTGAGALALRANMSDAVGSVMLDEGALALSGEALASRAEVWMDAADAATLTMNDQDKVTAVRNKGRAGGSFGACPGRESTTVPYPTYLTEAINGNGALVFDTNAGLQLSSYTNETSPRAVHIYAVMQGHGGDLAVEGKGKWGGPFSLYDSRQSGDDHTTTGSFQITETLTGDTGVNQSSKYMGNTGRGDVLPDGGLQQPYLFVAHQENNGALFAYEWAETDVEKITAFSMASTNAMSSTRVNLGGRSTTGGALQWKATHNSSNRTWAGYIGELVIVTRKLAASEEAALLAYLRKKWLAKGAGVATPPAFLSGLYAAPSLAGTGLACADGTSVAVAGAPVALASLTTAGTVDWTRTWDGLNAADATLFSVAGDVSLGAVNLDVVPKPKKEMMVLGWGGAALTCPTWTVTCNGITTGSTVSTRGTGYWLSTGGTFFFIR